MLKQSKSGWIKRSINHFVATLFRWKLPGSYRLTIALLGNDFPVVTTRTSHGLRFLADPASYIDQQILANGYFEPLILEQLLKCIGDKDVFWDIGANTGIHSVTVKHLRPSVHVISFEPSPINFTRLYLNASANNLDLDLRCLPLADKAGYLDLSILTAGNTGLCSLKPWSDTDYSRTISVWCDTADNLVSSGIAPQPNVIKLDVEGFEQEVFAGMRQLLASPELRTVIFEARKDLLSESPTYDLATFLRQYGFSIEPLGCEGDYVATRH